MTTLAEYLDASEPADLAALKEYLKITATGEDVQLTRWFADAIFFCNTKLSNRDFLAADGFHGDIPPSPAVTATYEYVRAYRDITNRGSVGQKRNRTGGRESEYMPESGDTAVEAAQKAAMHTLEAAIELALGYCTMGW